MINRLTIFLLKLLGCIPFSILYGLSNLLCILLYHIFRYRRNVITQNLKQSFPHKSENEIVQIRRSFYKYLCDLLFESFKGLYMSEAEFRKRFIWADPTIFDEEVQASKHIIMLGSHYGNWEWGAICMPLFLRHKLFGIYKPLSNKMLNAWLLNKRSRFGLQAVKMSAVARAMAGELNQPSMFAFIADQTPVDVDNSIWLRFLNQETPFFQGPEKLARRSGFPVYVYKIARFKRGFYSISFQKLCDNANQLPEGELTRIYARFLEQQIMENPSFWLWSHRRWKRKKPVNITLLD